MIIKSQIGKIINFFNLTDLDNRGGLIIPIDLKLSDMDYYKYRHLAMNPFVQSLTSDDLPSEFSPRAVRLVDVFRRKTIDLEYEVMLIFDYVTSEIIYSFVNDECDSNEVFGEVDENVFKGKHISIIHNHPKNYYSPPSARNFQILDLDFEDYELVSSWDSLWILESKNHIPKDEVNQIKEQIQYLYDFAKGDGSNNFGDEKIAFKNSSNLYGELLMEYIDGVDFNIFVQEFSGFFKPEMNCTLVGIMNFFILKK